jgi:hypothetical protein
MKPGDPYYLNPRERRRLRGNAAGILAALGLASLAFIAAVMYATMPDGRSPTAAAPRLTTPAPSTTGQGDRIPTPVAPAPLVLPADPSVPAEWK